jgi:REP element-mobilizing transposase RayT
VLPHVWSLRSNRSFRALSRCFYVARDRLGCRITHFSLQGNHAHLIVELTDEPALARAMQGFAIRAAKALNRLMRRRGKVFSDRYHTHVLRTPTEVARALGYVRNNYAHHATAWGERVPTGFVDAFSSFAHADLVAPPDTWLLREGWRRGVAGAWTTRGGPQRASP